MTISSLRISVNSREIPSSSKPKTEIVTPNYPMDASEAIAATITLGDTPDPSGRIALGYCRQVQSATLARNVHLLVSELLRFQLRARQRSLAKAKSRRRIVAGIAEVSRHALAGHLRMIIISTDLD